jgi:hypothetical protein
MRNGAHRTTRRLDALLGATNQLRDFRMLEVTHLPDRGRQIERTDENQVDAIDRENLVDVPDLPSRILSGRRSAGFSAQVAT